MNGQELLDAILPEVIETKLYAMYEEWIQQSKDVIRTSREFFPRGS
jgi:phage/plasmid-associated DNA primase